MAEPEDKEQGAEKPSFAASNFFSRRKRKAGVEKPEPAAPPLSETPIETPAPEAQAPSLPGWSKKKFGSAAGPAEPAPPMRVQMDWIEATFEKHPYRSLFAVALVLLLIVFDVALLFGRFSVTEWVMINFVPNSPIARYSQDRKTSLFPATAPAPAASNDEAAVARATATLYGLWDKPSQPASIKGIMSKKEAKELVRIKGIRDMALSSVTSFFDPSRPPQNLGRTMVAEAKAAKSPYGPAYDGAQAGQAFKAVGIDEKKAHKGEAMNQIAPEKDFVGTDPGDHISAMPQGDTAEEVMGDLSDRNKSLVEGYAASHGWHLHKHDADANMPPLPLDGLGKSWAAWQLYQTLKLNDRSTHCPLCMPENRLNDGRAQYFGEKR